MSVPAPFTEKEEPLNVAEPAIAGLPMSEPVHPLGSACAPAATGRTNSANKKRPVARAHGRRSPRSNVHTSPPSSRYQFPMKKLVAGVDHLKGNGCASFAVSSV